ncbi:MAG TPA: DUF488 family protein [Terriglobales bacterium]|nr:DUF488 family protein [Terriglobales bacterium]
MTVAVKRVYEKATRADGARVLVDRLWPRGVRKEAVHTWLKELAPSDGLRRWFHARPQRWESFRSRYLKELARAEASEALEELYRLAETRAKVTLLFASRNLEHNNAVVLKQLLDGMRKPPTGTGPAAAAQAGRERARARRPR